MVACRLLLADPNVTDNVFHTMARQPVQAPFIVVSHVYEGQTAFVAGAVEHYDTRISVEFITENAVECDQQSAAVKACLGNVIHQDVSNGDDPGWTDVCSLKAGGDILDYDDARTVYRRVIDFNISWKPA